MNISYQLTGLNCSLIILRIKKLSLKKKKRKNKDTKHKTNLN